MLVRQENPLNRSSVPDKRPQVQPGPVVVASGSDIADLQDSVTTLNLAVVDLQSRVDTLEATVAALQGRFAGLGDYADDTAAAAGGVPINGLYRNGSTIMVRVA